MKDVVRYMYNQPVGMNHGVWNEEKTLCVSGIGQGMEHVLELYAMHGKDCLAHMRGAFGFCLFDQERNELFAARDRMGEKTLYYAEIPGGVVFSTELKAILRDYILNHNWM